MSRLLVLIHAFLLCGAALLADPAFAQSWARHTIDASSQGADGVRLADADDDGRLDVVTGWEEGGLVRLYRHPGPAHVRTPWPAVTVGAVPNVEDAVLVDLDGDGRLEVVSAAEGDARRLVVHRRAEAADSLLDAAAWESTTVPPSVDGMQWMFTAPFSMNGRTLLVAGGKNEEAQIGLWDPGTAARAVEDWTWHPLADVGWVMSIIPTDMDGDGDLDVLYSDRKGPHRGVRWLENPGRLDAAWPDRLIGGAGDEVMFLARTDLDQDGREDVLAATAGLRLLFLRRGDRSGLQWQVFSADLPDSLGIGKGVAVGDIDLDRRPDIVVTTERAEHRSGVVWLRSTGEPWFIEGWPVRDVSGPVGTKYDRVELIDLDDDGDLDIMTCEERENLGVIWYENPTRTPRAAPESPSEQHE